MYEYKVLESTQPIIPPEMLNKEGEEGWLLTSIVSRRTDEGVEKWLFYFVKLVEKVPYRKEDAEPLKPKDGEPDNLGELAEHGQVPLGFAEQEKTVQDQTEDGATGPMHD
jgi:hypothetical protein